MGLADAVCQLVPLAAIELSFGFFACEGPNRSSAFRSLHVTQGRSRDLLLPDAIEILLPACVPGVDLEPARQSHAAARDRTSRFCAERAPRSCRPCCSGAHTNALTGALGTSISVVVAGGAGAAFCRTRRARP